MVGHPIDRLNVAGAPPRQKTNEVVLVKSPSIGLIRSATKKTSYGLLIYEGTDNIGDEIQSLAARRFLTDIDYLIDRERIASFRTDKEDEVVKVIFNGWFCHYPDRFAVADGLRILPISMHVTPSDRGTRPRHPGLLQVSWPGRLFLRLFDHDAAQAGRGEVR